MSLAFLSDESVGFINYDVTQLLNTRNKIASVNPLLRVIGGDEQGRDIYNATVKMSSALLTPPSALLAIPEEYIGMRGRLFLHIFINVLFFL
jgi:hypothetical protein